MGSRNQPTAAQRQDAEFEATLSQLRTEVQSLEADVRDLHEQLVRIYDRLDQGAAGAGLNIQDLELPPPPPGRPIFERAVKKLFRGSARAVRGVLQAIHPTHVPVHTLHLVRDSREIAGIPTIGGEDEQGEIVISKPESLTLGRQCDVERLFAMESVDAAWVGETFAVRKGLDIRCGRDMLKDLSRIARKAGRPVIAKDLRIDSTAATQIELRPAGRIPAETVWMGGPYVLALPPTTRQAELRLRASLPPAKATSENSSSLVIIDRSLINGLVHRIGAILEACRSEGPTGIISLADPGMPGDRRLDALESSECLTASVGAVLHPSLHPAATVSILRSRAVTTLWAIGDSPQLIRVVRACIEDNPEIRVLWEPISHPQHQLTGASLVIARSEEDRQRLSEVLDGQSVAVAPTPILTTTEHRPTPDANPRHDVKLVLFADDLSPESRPEDAAAVARHLSDHQEIRVLVVGEGSLAGAVHDLGRLFNLESFEVREPTGDISQAVASADVLCLPHDSPLLTPAAAVALQCGVPIATVNGRGELHDAAKKAGLPLTCLGPPGDTRALSESVLTALQQARGPVSHRDVSRQTPAKQQLRALLSP